MTQGCPDNKRKDTFLSGEEGALTLEKLNERKENLYLPIIWLFTFLPIRIISKLICFSPLAKFISQNYEVCVFNDSAAILISLNVED